eukprot:EG_transcript_15410
MTTAAGTIDVGRASAAVVPEAGLPPLEVRAAMPTVADLIFGCAGIGGLFTAVPEPQALATLRRALEVGFTEFDTAPWYGIGASERALGKVLPAQSGKVKVATKVGRVIRPASELDKEDPRVEWYSRKWWKVDHDDYTLIDMTRAGVLESFAQSSARLNGFPIHCLRLHDAEIEERFVAATQEGSGIDALLELRASGQVQEVSVGMNNADFFRKFLKKYPPGTFDTFLVSSCWNLLDVSGYDLFRECQEKGVAVINASVFGSGLLWGNDKMYYEDALPQHLALRERWQALAEKHGVSLPAVALQFAFLPRVVRQVAIGCRTPEEVDRNVALLKETVPASLWREARALGLLPDFIPVPE